MSNFVEPFSELGLSIQNTYAQLPDIFMTKMDPIPVKDPKVEIINYELAKELGLEFENIDRDALAQIFSGNKLPKNSTPLAQAYAGHQFGHFTMLGDGRALMMCEHLTPKNEIIDIQFKGSGRTPYSRGADGRAALGPMLREYLMSEALHHLGIPTTRSLAVVSTGEKILREVPMNGAVLTRVASSHIRVGTFQYAAARNDKDALKKLLDYSVKRHFPEIKNETDNVLLFLRSVMEKQIDLIVNWMRVGFIHGVMNTDNSTISGETIDYGPCAFMNSYDLNTVYSSIDLQGRYSYGNQPNIIHWNILRLAESLIGLIDEDEKKAVSIIEKKISDISSQISSKWLNMMLQKIGIENAEPEDEQLVHDLLKWMQDNKADFNNTFCYLMEHNHINDKVFETDSFKLWKNNWTLRVKKEKNYLDVMRGANPIFIPRNHLVENALDEADKGKINKFNSLIEVISKPYSFQSKHEEYYLTPEVDETNYQTFCGT